MFEKHNFSINFAVFSLHPRSKIIFPNKWTVHARCFTRLHIDLHNLRNAYHLHYECDDGMANGDNVVHGRSGDFCHYYLFCEHKTTQTMTKFYSPLSTNLVLYFSPQDSRNATMVAVKEPYKRSWAIVAMAAWLDHTSQRCSRIRWSATAQWTIQIMPHMHQTKCTMHTSIANDAREIRRIETQANTQTIDDCVVIVFPGSIHRHLFDATVYGANFHRIRQSSCTGPGHNNYERTR